MDLFNEIKDLKKKLTDHVCHACEYKQKHLDVINRLQTIDEEVKVLQSNLSEDNLAFMDEFEARRRILRELNYMDETENALIKARVARELGSADIFLCEVIMENVLIDLTPEEVAAILAAFVCQVKKVEIEHNDTLPETLLDAMDQVEDLCKNIINLEIKHQVIPDIEGGEELYLKEKVNFDLTKVVYEWACQKDFAEICKLTDAQEGSIVRTILRLDILLRGLTNACKVMGNMKLLKLIEDASHLIRRDIVFAGSLYLE
eukprot:CAMPEP_0114581822 /NCGR_PEP_ID=MMETSP0125-20121206/5889_1 /TAXON_ID=485358 ORGANISM="Aristerostoma sp., Strain ATCC 50986" /NCGR_SAMPLE_ID=MMETSP0125 /ASSEMBLY_ACC=CAM_ASM_000245 /LENGTH=259 /DNA_ID=CAMNT_0001774331 /DNA_START=910 /DNA_END=1689 /DNA_ORIENTATION=+